MALRKVKKVLQIDSADRDSIKYITNGDYVVYLPRVYRNVTSIRLMGAEFPPITSSLIRTPIDNTINSFTLTPTSTSYTGNNVLSSNLILTFKTPNNPTADNVTIRIQDAKNENAYYVTFSTKYNPNTYGFSRQLTVPLTLSNLQLKNPYGVAVDSSGNIYISEYTNHRIIKVIGSTFSVIAGSATASGNTGDNGPATSALLKNPYGIALDSNNNIYIADYGNTRIRMIYVASNGTRTGGLLTNGLTVGNIYAIAGTGTYSYSGNNVAATSATLRFPKGVAIDSTFNVYIADTNNNVIRKITNSTGLISTIAGANPTTGAAAMSTFAGDGTSTSTSWGLAAPQGVSVYLTGIYIADTGNNRVRVFSSGGSISTISGSTMGYSGDGGLATSAKLSAPTQVFVDSTGIYVADAGNNRIRSFPIGAGANINTIAGTTTSGFSGDGGLATSAQLSSPNAIVKDANGNFYIADRANNRIRMFTVGGNISTVVGTTFVDTQTIDSGNWTYNDYNIVNGTSSIGDTFTMSESNGTLTLTKNGSILTTTPIVSGTYTLTPYLDTTGGNSGSYSYRNVILSNTFNINAYYFLVELEGLNKSDETRVGGDKSSFIDNYFAKIPALTNASGKIVYSDSSLPENIAKCSPPLGALDRLHIRTRLHSQQDRSGFIYSPTDHNMTFEIEYIDNVANIEEK